MANRTGTNNSETLFGDPNGVAENDVLRGLGGHDELYGLDGSDILDGGDGNDWLDAGLGGNEALYGGNGDDTMLGGGADYMQGGFGNDLYYVNNVNDAIVEEYGEGFDTVRSFISYSLEGSGFVENLVLESGAANGTGNGLNNEIYGNAADNLLSGGDGNDVLRGGSGNDTLYGGAGYDAATYSEQYTKYNAAFTRDGAVQITGSEGTDLLHGIERIYFGDGGFYNVYTGDAGANSLTADPNVWSLLYGGNGNDTLTGGNYNDILAGGNGNDTLYGGGGYDIATYFGQHTSYGASFTSNGAVRITGSEGTDLLHGIEHIRFAAGHYNVHTGDESNNSLTADPNVWSLMYGGNGNDALTGGNGNDTLTGGKGNDILIGGNGKDILTGGSGKDTLYGGSGADKFRFDFKTEGIDIIKDFNRTEGDKIEIVKSSFGATSLSQFSYNSTTGALLFGSTHLATIGNKPAGFSVQGDVVLV